ncbi:MAG: hypothetical protein U0Q16_12370 [Bryobacteraceae bacterium]
MKIDIKRLTIGSAFAALLAIGSFSGSGSAQGPAVSGNGKYKFKVLYTSSHLPPQAQEQKVLKAAHGGFGVDRRPGKGDVYFALPGAGIIKISGDLKSTTMVPTDPSMRDTNMHNATLWHAPDGTPYLSFPGNNAQKVFVTTLDGKLVGTLAPPDGSKDLGLPIANDYFLGRGPFIPTDTDFQHSTLYISTGYSNLDVVLTARVTSWAPFQIQWHDLAFGGKGTGPGQFGTGHGITIPPGTTRVDVADRPNAEIDRFTRYGQYLSTLKTPLGSLPCDIYYHGNYAVIGALDGPDRSKGAPIYLYENDKLVSTIIAREDLGLANFAHIHNAVLREIDGKLYIIAQAWNPGDFAILEQVM